MFEVVAAVVATISIVRRLMDKHLDSRMRRSELRAVKTARLAPGEELSVTYSHPDGASVHIRRGPVLPPPSSPDAG